MNVFISRKQKRKEERKNKKLNKNMYFQMKNKDFKLKFNNNKNNDKFVRNQPAVRKDKNKYMLNLKENDSDNDFVDDSNNEGSSEKDYDDDDEEINSDEASLHPEDDSEANDSEDMNMNAKSNKNDNFNEENDNSEENENEEFEDKLFGKDYYNKNIADKIDYSKIDEELDKELKYLENKLKLKKGKNLDLLKKRMVKDNFDDDLFDLLDSIDNKDSNAYFKEKKRKNSEDDSLDIEDVEENKKVKSSKIKKKLSEKQKNESKVNLTSGNEDLELIGNKDLNFSKLKKSTLKSEKTINEIANESESNNINIQAQDILLFKKSLNALFNKTSDSNIMILYKDVIELIINQINKISEISRVKTKENSITNKKNILNKVTFEKNLYEMFNSINGIIFKSVLENEFMNIGITSCLITYVCMLQSVLGDVYIKLFLTQLFEKFYRLSEEKEYDVRVNKLRNFVFIMIFIFLNKSLNLKLANDLISFLIKNFDEYYSEILYIFISHIGIFIRREQPESIKKIIIEVKQKYEEVKGSVVISSKFKFVVDMIEEIKDNKFLKFNLGEKYGFLKNLVNTNKKSNNTQELINLNHKEYTQYLSSSDEIEISLVEIDSYIMSGKFVNEDFFEFLNNENKVKISENNKVNDNQSNSNDELNEDDFSIDSEDIEQQYSLIKNKSDLKNENVSDFNRQTTEKFNALCKQLKINTDLKKKIFKIIAFAEDVKDSYEKLMKLNLNKEQSREIIKITVLTSTKEVEFNRFYLSLISMFIKFNKDYKYTFQYTCWDYIRNFENLSDNEKENLKQLIVNLLIDNLVNFTTLLPLKVTDKEQHNFLKDILENYLNNADYNNLKMLISKLVKNDTHNDFYTRLLGLLNSEFKNKTISSSTNVTNEEMLKIESYNDNLKEFKRILKKVVVN